jgi:DNA-directed RNA polymerase subunit RPC12/RpoP
MKFFNIIWNAVSKKWKQDNVAGPVPAPPVAAPEVQISKLPGLDCPSCGFRMIISVPMLLSGEPVICPSCRLKLTVEREQSKACLTELEKVYEAVKNVETVKNK